MDYFNTSAFRQVQLKFQFILIIIKRSQYIMNEIRMGMDQRIQTILQRNQYADLFQKAFLKPIQISLRFDALSQSALANGLTIASKSDISLNKFKNISIDPISFPKQIKQNSYEYLVKNNLDNMLSLKKSLAPQLKLAVCVTLGNQDKDSVEITMSSLKQNLKLLIENGVPAEEIAIVFVTDGFMNMDPSLFAYFQALQQENSIYLGQNEIPNLADHQLQQDVEEYDLIVNLNDIIFSEQQLHERKNRRLLSRKIQMQEVEKLKKQIKEFSKIKNLVFDNFQNHIIENIFLEIAHKRRKQQYGEDERQIGKKSRQFYISLYGENKSVLKNTLNEAKKYCQDYLQSRSNLALMSSFRFNCPLNKEQPQQQNLQGNQSLGNLKQFDLASTKGQVKIDLFVISKYTQSGKLSSHNWFINGFCNQLRPQYIVLMDAGQRIEKKTFFKALDFMHRNQEIGGACVYSQIQVLHTSDNFEKDYEHLDGFSQLVHQIFNIQRAQVFQNNIDSLINKPYKSMFGYISNMPGSFSIFRYQQGLKKDLQFHRFLEEHYFSPLLHKHKQISTNISDTTCCDFLTNIILPFGFTECCSPKKEDQNLLQSLNLNSENENRVFPVVLHNAGYKSKYIPNVTCFSKANQTLIEQCQHHSKKIKSSYCAMRTTRQLQSYYNILGIFGHGLEQFLDYIFPAIFLFAILLVLNAFQANIFRPLCSIIFPQIQSIASISQVVIWIITFIYLMTYLGLFLFSTFFNLKESRFIGYLYGISSFHGVFSIIIFIVLLVRIIEWLIPYPQPFTAIDENLIQFLPGGQLSIAILIFIFLGFIGINLLPLFVHAVLNTNCHVIWDMIISFFSYVFYLPTFTGLFYLYGLCKLDQNKKYSQQRQTKKWGEIQQSWRSIRLQIASKYIFWNIIFGITFHIFSGYEILSFYCLFIIVCLYALNSVIKASIAIVSLFKEKCLSLCHKQKKFSLYTDFQDQAMKKFAEWNVKDDLVKIVQSSQKKQTWGNMRLQSSIQITGPSIVLKNLYGLKKQSRKKSYL